MTPKEMKIYEAQLNVVEERIMAGKRQFGDNGLRKLLIRKLAEK